MYILFILHHVLHVDIRPVHTTGVPPNERCLMLLLSCLNRICTRMWFTYWLFV